MTLTDSISPLLIVRYHHSNQDGTNIDTADKGTTTNNRKVVDSIAGQEDGGTDTSKQAPTFGD